MVVVVVNRDWQWRWLVKGGLRWWLMVVVVDGSGCLWWRLVVVGDGGW